MGKKSRRKNSDPESHKERMDERRKRALANLNNDASISLKKEFKPKTRTEMIDSLSEDAQMVIRDMEAFGFLDIVDEAKKIIEAYDVGVNLEDKDSTQNAIQQKLCSNFNLNPNHLPYELRCVIRSSDDPPRKWPEGAQVPSFFECANYPEHIGQLTYISASNVKCRKCPMCNQECAYRTKFQSNDGYERYIVKGRGDLCSDCVEVVWEVKESELEIKYCRSGKHFEARLKFGDMLDSSNCASCREKTTKRALFWRSTQSSANLHLDSNTETVAVASGISPVSPPRANTLQGPCPENMTMKRIQALNIQWRKHPRLVEFLRKNEADYFQKSAVFGYTIHHKHYTSQFTKNFLEFATENGYFFDENVFSFADVRSRITLHYSRRQSYFKKKGAIVGYASRKVVSNAGIEEQPINSELKDSSKFGTVDFDAKDITATSAGVRPGRAMMPVESPIADGDDDNTDSSEKSPAANPKTAHHSSIKKQQADVQMGDSSKSGCDDADAEALPSASSGARRERAASDDEADEDIESKSIEAETDDDEDFDTKSDLSEADDAADY